MSDERSEIVTALREELRKPMPMPEGFPERVLSRALATKQPSVSQPWRWAAAAALLLAGALGAWHEQEVEKEQQRAKTQQQLRYAMRMANERLEAALTRGINAPLAEATEQVQEGEQ